MIALDIAVFVRMRPALGTCAGCRLVMCLRGFAAPGNNVRRSSVRWTRRLPALATEPGLLPKDVVNSMAWAIGSTFSVSTSFRISTYSRMRANWTVIRSSSSTESLSRPSRATLATSSRVSRPVIVSVQRVGSVKGFRTTAFVMRPLRMHCVQTRRVTAEPPSCI